MLTLTLVDFGVELVELDGVLALALDLVSFLGVEGKTSSGSVSVLPSSSTLSSISSSEALLGASSTSTDCGLSLSFHEWDTGSLSLLSATDVVEQEEESIVLFVNLSFNK